MTSCLCEVFFKQAFHSKSDEPASYVGPSEPMEDPNCILRNLENYQRIYLEPNWPFFVGLNFAPFSVEQIFKKSSFNPLHCTKTYTLISFVAPSEIVCKANLRRKKTWKPTPRGSLRRTFVSPGSMFFCNTVFHPRFFADQGVPRVQVHGGHLCKLYGYGSRENPLPKTALEGTSKLGTWILWPTTPEEMMFVEKLLSLFGILELFKDKLGCLKSWGCKRYIITRFL